MTATDELRRLLDERGVKWEPSVFDSQHETFYEVNGVGIIVTEFPEIQRMSFSSDMRITPKQVIETTLGRGTCKWEPADFITEGEWWNTSCGESFTWEPDGTPRYCPNCGRQVVDS